MERAGMKGSPKEGLGAELCELPPCSMRGLGSQG